MLLVSLVVVADIRVDNIIRDVSARSAEVAPRPTARDAPSPEMSSPVAFLELWELLLYFP